MVAGNYYHLAITYDGTTANVYVNSVLLASGSPTGYVPGTDGPFSMGVRSDLGFPWEGKEDEVAFYGTVLTPSQIAAHYAAATTNAAGYASQVLALNPLVYFRLNEPGDPQAANLGTLGAAGNGAYIEGSHPGAPGPVPPALPGFEAGNKSISLDGTGGYAAVPGLNLNNNSVTFTGWINANGDQTPLTGLIFNRAGSTVGGLAIDVSGGTALTYNWSDDTATYNWASGVSLTASDWTFVALVIQPNQAAIFAADNTNYLGFSGATNPVTHAVQAFEGATLLGADLSPNGGSGPAYFNGSIDEVAIFDRALGVGEVYTEYASAVGGVPVQIFGNPTAPLNQLYTGDTLTLTVDAGGTPPLSYQWRIGGVEIQGATSSAYVNTNVQVVADSGNYDVVITNAFGSATSAPVVPVTVLPVTAPVISQNPSSRTLYVGGTLDLSVAATGGQLAYQWQKNSNPISGATDSTYAIGIVGTNDAGSYTVTVTNRLGSASSSPPAVITVISPAAGTFEAAIVADSPEAWWRLDDAPGSTNMLDSLGRHDGTYSGNVTLGVPGAVANGGNTAATFDGASYGSVPFSRLLNTEAFTVEVWAKAVNVTDQRVPASSRYSTKGWYFQSAVPTYGQWAGGVAVGGTDYYVPCTAPAASMQTNVWTQLVMTESTNGLLVFINGQWDGGEWADFDRNNGGPFIIGARGLSSSQPVDLFWKGEVDEVTFYTNSLTLGQIQAHYAAALYGNTTKPFFTLQPQSQTAAAGSQVSFKVIVEGSAPISLQWWKDGSQLLNQTNDTLTLLSVTTASNGTYQVTATNAAGSIASSPASLTVQPVPTSANLTNGLVLHLKLDNDYTDSSGNGNNGTPNGSPVLISGQVSNAVSLLTDIPSATYNYVSINQSTSLAFTAADSFSVAFWVNYTNNPNPDDLPMIGNAVGATYQKGWVVSDDGGHLEWTLVANDFTSVIADPVGGPVIADLKWHNVVISYDRTIGVANTYIDGTQVDSRSIQGLGGLDNGNPIALGQDPTGTYDPSSNTKFSGAYNIDDLGIWRKALSTFDAQSIYAAGQLHKSFDVPSAAPPTLSLGFQGGVWKITYTGTLQSSATVNGTYNDVNGASSPYTVPTGSATMQFYRARN
jgi:hypothetical protein